MLPPQETTSFQILELIEILSGLRDHFNNLNPFLNINGLQSKMVIIGPTCQLLPLTLLTFSLTVLQKCHKLPKQTVLQLSLVSLKDHLMLPIFNQILIQFAQVQVAHNTKPQRLRLTQWIISFQTLELIIISQNLIAVNNGLLKKLDTPGFGKRKKKKIQLNTKLNLLTLT